MTAPAHTSEREALKPCPFCGVCGETEEAGNGTFMALCMGCYCNVGESHDRHGTPDHMFRTEAEAVAAWNTRTASQPPAQTVPDGWRLVPVEPTEAMVDAFRDLLINPRWIRLRIRTMIDAAPAPEGTP